MGVGWHLTKQSANHSHHSATFGTHPVYHMVMVKLIGIWKGRFNRRKIRLNRLTKQITVTNRVDNHPQVAPEKKIIHYIYGHQDI